MTGLSARLGSEASSYRVVRWLGEGLTSVVCLAEREDSRGHSAQRVALKILKSETKLQWLRREFDVLRAVESPHCVRVLAWENIPGHGPALVMDAIEGATLEELASHRPFSEVEAQEVARQLQEGLTALRAAGACHGDVSPRNALLDESGRLRLIDFGAPDKESGTAATLAYAAPEIWRGAAVSWQSDLFSLGLLRQDLCDGLRVSARLGDEREACARAESRACPGDPWLDPVPEVRRARRILPSPEAKASLAARVAGLLEERRSGALARTREISAIPAPVPMPVPVQVPAIVPARPIEWPAAVFTGVLGNVPAVRGLAWRALALGAALALIAVPCRVVSSLQSARHRGERSASIVVRSLKWKEIWLNGERAGFAPLVIQGLRPGPHRLSWRGPEGRGDLRFFAGEGARLRIGDLALSSGRAERIVAEGGD